MTSSETTAGTALEPMSGAEWDAAYRRGTWVWDEPPPAELTELLLGYLPPPATVVDLGCGIGTTARTVAALGYSVHGCDASAVAIELARSRSTAGDGCRFSVLDVVQQTDQIPSADLAIDRGVLHTRPSPASRTAFVAAVATVCAPGAWWLHIGAAASDAAGSTSFVRGPSALTEIDFRTLTEPYFTLHELRDIPYGTNPGETDFDARIAMLRRR
ncbi:MAG: class I SAM-dependent methyltransferase [Jatrophihabitans sp.]